MQIKNQSGSSPLWQRLVQCGSLAVLVSLAFAIPAWSATKPAPAPPPAPAQKSADVPVAIEVTDVIPRSVRALNRLRDIREKLDADTSVSVVEAGLPAFGQKLDEWWKAEASTVKQLHSVQRVNELLWEWGRRDAQIDSWNSLLATSSKEGSAEEQTLDRLTANWQATQSALKKTAPAAVRNTIIEVLREGEATRRLFQDKTAQLVAVQGKLAARRASLHEIQKQLEAIREQSRLNLLSLDSPPLWIALSGAEASRSIAAQTRERSLKFYDEAVEFFQTFRTRMLFHLALFIALVGLFLFLRHLSRKPSAIQPTVSEQFILERSFSSALLLALVSVPVLYIDANPQILRLVVIPGLMPVLMLAPAIFAPRLRIGFYFFTVIYLLDFLRNYLPPQWLLARLLLLSVAVFGTVGIAVLLRAQNRESAAVNVPSGAMRSLLHIGMLLFVGSFIANVAGNLTVAEVLVSPLVRVLFLGAAIRLGAVVATTFALMALRTPLALLSRMVRDRGETAAAQLRRLVNLAATGLWIYLALVNLGLVPDLQNALNNFLQLEWQVGAAVISVREFVSFILVFSAAYVLSRVLRIILAEEIFPRIQLPRGVPDALELLARYGVLLFGFLLALISAGVNLSQVTLAISALGVGIGFGLQNIVNNFVSGLILVFEHPIQVGDYVEAGTHFGRVQRIGFRASVVRTLDGAEVIIPNAELIGTKVTNWSLSDRQRRVTIQVPVAFGTDPDRVIDILNAVARNQPNVLTNPAPSVVLDKFGDSALEFLLRCWTQTETFASVRYALTVAINKAFQEAGIRIPFPQTDVHVHWSENVGVNLPPIEKSK